MKSHLSLIFISLTFVLASQDVQISNIKSLEGLTSFIRDNFQKDWEIQTSLTPDEFRIKLERTRDFHKVDLDGNGLIDLVVNDIRRPIAILAFDNNEYLKYPLYTGRDIGYCQFSILSVESANSLPQIILQQASQLNLPNTNIINRIDTLIFKNQAFVEYNPKPTNGRIDTIVISTTNCFGPCPVFDLAISADGAMKFVGEEHVLMEGDYQDTVPQEKLLEIFEILNYIGLDTFREAYSVGYTDGQTIKVGIRYNGNQKITLSDYGLSGTRGLAVFYNKIFDLLRQKQLIE